VRWLSRELLSIPLVLVAAFPHAAHREADAASNTTIGVLTVIYPSGTEKRGVDDGSRASQSSSKDAIGTMPRGARFALSGAAHASGFDRRHGSRPLSHRQGLRSWARPLLVAAPSYCAQPRGEHSVTALMSVCSRVREFMLARCACVKPFALH
jgi:hypothetical protein